MSYSFRIPVLTILWSLKWQWHLHDNEITHKRQKVNTKVILKYSSYLVSHLLSPDIWHWTNAQSGCVGFSEWKSTSLLKKVEIRGDSHSQNGDWRQEKLKNTGNLDRCKTWKNYKQLTFISVLRSILSYPKEMTPFLKTQVTRMC